MYLLLPPLQVITPFTLPSKYPPQDTHTSNTLLPKYLPPLTVTFVFSSSTPTTTTLTSIPRKQHRYAYTITSSYHVRMLTTSYQTDFSYQEHKCNFIHYTSVSHIIVCIFHPIIQNYHIILSLPLTYMVDIPVQYYEQILTTTTYQFS